MKSIASRENDYLYEKVGKGEADTQILTVNRKQLLQFG